MKNPPHKVDFTPEIEYRETVINDLNKEIENIKAQIRYERGIADGLKWAMDKINAS